ncbi:MAG TPA: ATP-binding protein [Acidimicrobiales bacterium]|nr:ATP-binding protein [Acidimicrobiales bacterium]
MKIPRHESTTAQLGAAYPFVSGSVLPSERVVIGRDLSGLSFAYDPFDLYQAGVLTNPNMVVLGQVGRGKSALVKSYLYRQYAFGRRIVVIDPKGEYGPLAAAVGGEIVRLTVDGTRAFNPLGSQRWAGDQADVGALEHSVLEGICAASLGRRLDAGESVALQVALVATRRESRSVTLRSIRDRLFCPSSQDAHGIGIARDRLAQVGEMPGFAIARLLGGDFGSMFDADEAREIKFAARVLVVDVSDFYRSDALSVLLISLFGALQRVVMQSGVPTIFVIDEAWAVLANPLAASFIQTFFKLSRSLGVANVLVAHRPSDITGEYGESFSGSAAVTPSALPGLISDCEMVVTYALSVREALLAQRLFGLNDRQCGLLTGLGRNVALWRVANRVSLVRHHLSEAEMSFVDTDARMRL